MPEDWPEKGDTNMTKSEVTEKRLELEGWVYDHTATVRRYTAVGCTEHMVSRCGYDYIRVYTSECKGKRRWQLTHVYRRLSNLAAPAITR